MNGSFETPPSQKEYGFLKLHVAFSQIHLFLQSLKSFSIKMSLQVGHQNWRFSDKDWKKSFSLEYALRLPMVASLECFLLVRRRATKSVS
jgi:hypothetical protein